MSFTVLGASGVIGTALVQALMQQACPVRALGRDFEQALGQPWGHVIYAIGLTADFRSRPHETVEAHVGVLSRVLREARFDSLLYLSSTRVYQGATRTTEDVLLGASPSDPSDLYNLSKLLGESLCLTDRRPTVRVARLSNVVGGQDQASPNFIPSLMREAAGGCIRLRSHPQSAKDYIAMDDVVRLLPRIARDGRHRLYNVASGQQTRHDEWVRRIQARHPCRVEWLEDAPDQSFPPIDVRRLQSEFGHAPSCVFAATGL